MRSLCVKQRPTVRRADQRAGDRHRLAHHRVKHVGVIDHVQLVAGDPVATRLGTRFRLGVLDRPVGIIRVGLGFVVLFLFPLDLDVVRVLAAQVNQAVVVKDRLAEVPAVGVLGFAVLVLLDREVDG